jgi:thiamine pyridinylase
VDNSKILVLATFVSLVSACAKQATSDATQTPASPAGATIDVAMFKYIPDANGDDFAALWQHYEDGFAAAHEDDRFRAEVGVPEEGSFYDADDIAGWMRDSGYDLVEIDLVMLGDVLATGAIAPFRVVDIEDRFFPAALEASTLDGEHYGVPHLMCTYFLFSRDTKVAAARSFAELEAAMAKLPANAQRFAGNLTGDWDATALYVESWTMQARGTPVESLAASPVAGVLANLATLAQSCELDGANPCTDGTYGNQWNAPAERFAAGHASTMFGYSERMWVVMTSDPQAPAEIRPSALALGTIERPLLFTDSFVISASCTGECLRAAVAFVDYVTSDAELGYMLASEDAGPEAVPRYLLPANPDAARHGKLAEDIYYPQFLDALRESVPQPSTGVPAYREAHGAELIATIAGG